jgi:hypothetical protein
MGCRYLRLKQSGLPLIHPDDRLLQRRFFRIDFGSIGNQSNHFIVIPNRSKALLHIYPNPLGFKATQIPLPLSHAGATTLILDQMESIIRPKLI